MSAIADGILEEAVRLVKTAERQGLVLRLIGGLAVRAHRSGTHPVLEREFRDIDFVSMRGNGVGVGDFLEAMGYEADRVFNTMNAGRRLLFVDRSYDRRVDVFLGSFRMCHPIPLEERLQIDAVTIPLAELLLTKLQIVELNDKDLRDILSLLHEHDVGERDEETINAARIAALCARDWGLWRTCKFTVERVRAALETYGLSSGDRTLLADRLDLLWSRIEAQPKTRAWKVRARVGDRVRWYEEPEEIG